MAERDGLDGTLQWVEYKRQHEDQPSSLGVVYIHFVQYFQNRVEPCRTSENHLKMTGTDKDRVVVACC